MAQTKVLIIEDEESIAEMYALKLETSGFLVNKAPNGRIGLGVAKAWKPDIILLDLMMPVMSGDKMLAKLRETKWGAEIKVIILTNISRSEAPSILRYLNVEQYVIKAHSTPSEVCDIVREATN
jgi:DNA-binding response OmpR family regulator